MEKISISVAMTTYNGGRFLEEQLDSIFSQTLVPNEVVVVDDGSEDNTISILKKYSENHNLRFYVNSTHLGINRNFEKAIRLTSGDVVFLSDQDDVWMRNKIEVMVETALKLGISQPMAISSMHYDVDENLVVQKDYYRQLILNSSSPEGTVFFHNSQGCSMLINRKLIDNLPEFPKDIMFDRFIGLFAVSFGTKYNLSERLAFYRHHSSNVTSVERKTISLKGKFGIFLGNRLITRQNYQDACAFMREYEKYIVNDESKRCFDSIEKYPKMGFLSKILVIWRFKSLHIGDKVSSTFALIIAFFFQEKLSSSIVI